MRVLLLLVVCMCSHVNANRTATCIGPEDRQQLPEQVAPMRQRSRRFFMPSPAYRREFAPTVSRDSGNVHPFASFARQAKLPAFLFESF